MIDIDRLDEREMLRIINGLSRLNKARILFKEHCDKRNEILAINYDQRVVRIRAELKAIASIAHVLGVRDEDLMK